MKAVHLANVLSPDDLAHVRAVQQEAVVRLDLRRTFRRGRKLLPGYKEANRSALDYVRGPGAEAILQIIVPALSREFSQPGWETELRELRQLKRRLQKPATFIFSPYSPATLIMNLATL